MEDLNLLEDQDHPQDNPLDSTEEHLEEDAEEGPCVVDLEDKE